MRQSDRAQITKVRIDRSTEDRMYETTEVREYGGNGVKQYESTGLRMYGRTGIGTVHYILHMYRCRYHTQKKLRARRRPVSPRTDSNSSQKECTLPPLRSASSKVRPSRPKSVQIDFAQPWHGIFSDDRAKGVRSTTELRRSSVCGCHTHHHWN